MQKLLTENNSHIFICGQTRSGKTYFAAQALSQLKRPVLFFNIQDEDLPKNFLKVDSEDITGDQIIEALKDGMKIDLRLPERSAQMNRVMGYLIDRLMAAGFTESNPVYLALDECHIYKKEGLEGGIQAATRGLKRGCRCIFITQRPALASKTLYTQASEQYIFYLAPSEKEYIKNKGLDYDECMKYWEKLGDYSHIFYDGFKLEGEESNMKDTKQQKILYTKNGLEYYLNSDNKLVSRSVDLYKDYRKSELLPEVEEELNLVRSTGQYPSDHAINSVITYQNECPEKAINYIRYRYLGTCSYLDVFGQGAERYYREKKHMEQNERMEGKIGDLQQQLTDMQQLMFNIAKSVNQTSKPYTYRAG